MKNKLLVLLIVSFILGCKKEEIKYDVNNLKDFNFFSIHHNMVGYPENGVTKYFNDTIKYLFPDSKTLLILSNLYIISAVPGERPTGDYILPFYKDLYYSVDTTRLEYSVTSSSKITFTNQQNICHMVLYPPLPIFTYKSMDILEFNDRELMLQINGTKANSIKDTTSFVTLQSGYK